MDIVLVTDSVKAIQPFMAVTERSVHSVRKVISLDDDLTRSVDHLQPDVLVIYSDDVDRRVLQKVRLIDDVSPVPLLLFTRDAAELSISAAIKAGVTSYIANCDRPERFDYLLHITRARFEEQQRIKSELVRTRQALDERKKIERAKGIVMKNRHVSEEQAYNAMRKLAMNQNRRIGDIADQIISAAKVLV